MFSKFIFANNNNCQKAYPRWPGERRALGSERLITKKAVTRNHHFYSTNGKSQPIFKQYRTAIEGGLCDEPSNQEEVYCVTVITAFTCYVRL
jgi:hypothetical protein